MRDALLLLFGLAVWGAASLAAGAPPPPPEGLRTRTTVHLYREKDYRGPVRRAIVDPAGGPAHFATACVFYRIEGIRAVPVVDASKRQRGGRILAAPGGEVIAGLYPVAGSRGLFEVQLMDLEGRDKGPRLRSRADSPGFRSLYLGFRGGVILTAAPLGNPDSRAGPVAYTFWNTAGMRGESHHIAVHHDVILEGEGRALLFLGPNGAQLYSHTGGRSGDEIPGRFVAAAVARAGDLMIQISRDPQGQRRIHVRRGGSAEEILDAPAPVHDIRIASDGSVALIIGKDGRYFYLDPAGMHLRPGPPLPFPGTFRITDAEFIDSERVAFGVLHRGPDPPPRAWPRGSIVVVDRAGGHSTPMEFPIREATAFVPGIDVTPGSSSFAVYTEDTLVIVQVGP